MSSIKRSQLKKKISQSILDLSARVSCLWKFPKPLAHYSSGWIFKREMWASSPELMTLKKLFFFFFSRNIYKYLIEIVLHRTGHNLEMLLKLNYLHSQNFTRIRHDEPLLYFPSVVIWHIPGCRNLKQTPWKLKEGCMGSRTRKSSLLL